MSSKGAHNRNSVKEHQNGFNEKSRAAGPALEQYQENRKSSQQSVQKKDGVLASIKKLRVASKRPLPIEMGDGSYRTEVVRPGLKQDVRRLKMAGKCHSICMGKCTNRNRSQDTIRNRLPQAQGRDAAG